MRIKIVSLLKEHVKNKSIKLCDLESQILVQLFKELDYSNIHEKKILVEIAKELSNRKEYNFLNLDSYLSRKNIS